MKLKKEKIFDIDTWKEHAPPMGGDKQWREGRSALELARYMTSEFPNMPKELEAFLANFTDRTAEFEWSAEYVTDFSARGLGRGEGRNHDAFLWSDKIAVGIEGKADEPLGSDTLGEAMKNASPNKMLRINKMTEMLFGNSPENHQGIRYQLLTASTATLLEAKESHADIAVLAVIVFKKSGYYSERKIEENNRDIEHFLNDTNAVQENGYFRIPTVYGDGNNIKFYFKKIEITL